MDAPRRLSLLVCVAAMTSCVAPIVKPTPRGPIVLERFPSGTEPVEVVTADGITLRGVFVPASSGERVVLHLLPTGACVPEGVFGGLGGFQETLGALGMLGYSSLVIDYRGVGASDGRRRPTRLLEDGRAMWDEAVRRTGGNADAVIVRAASLGAIPLAGLLEQGRRPGGMVLAAPVCATTISANGARHEMGAFLGSIAALFMRRPADTDLVAVIGESATPALILLARDDDYMPAAEQERLVASAASGPTRFERLDTGHIELVLRFYGFELGAASGGVVDRLTEHEAAFLADL